MNVSNLGALTQPTTTAVKVDSNSDTKSASRGNSLPVFLPITPLVEKIQNENLTSQPSEEELNEVIIEINDTSLVRSSNIKFSAAEGIDINVIRVEDAETGELIRQIPAEEMQAVAQALRENMLGTIVEETV